MYVHRSIFDQLLTLAGSQKEAKNCKNKEKLCSRQPLAPYKIPSKAILGAGTPQTRKKARAGAPKMCPRLIKSAKNQANNERLQTKRPCTKLGAAVLPPGGLSIKSTAPVAGVLGPCPKLDQSLGGLPSLTLPPTLHIVPAHSTRIGSATFG